jgi:hypothetical protein
MLIMLLLLVAAAAGAAYAVAALPKQFGSRIARTRTPVPGQRDARVAAGTYVIYFEVQGGFGFGGNSGANISVPDDLTVSVAPPGGGPLTLAPVTDSVELNGLSTEAVSIDTVRIPRSGVYRVSAAWPGAAGYRTMVVLGAPALDELGPIGTGTAIAVLALLVLAFLARSTCRLLLARRRDAPPPARDWRVPESQGRGEALAVEAARARLAASAAASAAAAAPPRAPAGMPVLAVGSRGQPGAPTGGPAAGRDPLDEVAKLADLRDRGVLDADEFEAQKRRILG